ncbi:MULTISPECIES: 4-oxalocrotonate tautomerase family protein [unclassified Sphingopyxis]|jgi:4-oxalocrotonate tautomerase|uniref:tautomerase family protein n=1 Tax=unclassified Sphingopyxis TaxID=2614943 RepID=UPI0006C60853|nr:MULTISPECIES: 4-oxalocrotonate tautomerase family protein [unclassified Sphingopyxis]USI77192.1 4-oxalocrotonate tautomerase family protein [Sphingopyxis sp. USTB-05]GAO80347.1 4-oxalocrotonate tautomerase [Sphingopyxis sp. C-1]
MPIVTVQLTREGTEPGVDHVTPEQKAEIYKGMSQVLLDVLGKPLDWTWVIFQEVEMEDWGWGGMPVEEYRKKLAATSG